MSDPRNPGPLDALPGNTPDPTPLAGQTIVVTRAAEQADSFCRRLEQLGAKAISHPVIRILPPESWLDLDRVLGRIEQFDWLVFVSTNSVRFLIDRLVDIHGSLEKLKNRKIAAIGKSTADQLMRFGNVDVDLVPPFANSLSLGEALTATAIGQRVLIARADRRTTTLTDVLLEAKIEFEELIAYQSRDVESVDLEVAKRISDNLVDWITITSGAIARSTIRVFGEDVRKAKLVSISPGTSAVLRELGFEPDAEAETYDMNGMVEAIRQYRIRGM